MRLKKPAPHVAVVDIRKVTGGRERLLWAVVVQESFRNAHQVVTIARYRHKAAADSHAYSVEAAIGDIEVDEP